MSCSPWIVDNVNLSDPERETAGHESRSTADLLYAKGPVQFSKKGHSYTTTMNERCVDIPRDVSKSKNASKIKDACDSKDASNSKDACKNRDALATTRMLAISKKVSSCKSLCRCDSK
jgi:hypothetical protein